MLPRLLGFFAALLPLSNVAVNPSCRGLTGEQLPRPLLPWQSLDRRALLPNGGGFSTALCKTQRAAHPLRLRGGKLAHTKSTKRRKASDTEDVDSAMQEMAGDAQQPKSTGEGNKTEKRTRKKPDKKKKKKKLKKKPEPEPFLPWVHQPEEGEVLVPDLQAYDCLFPLLLEWPALSFAFLERQDAPRKTFPFATAIAVGTQVSLAAHDGGREQAVEASDNKVTVVQLSGMRHYKKKKTAEERGGDADDDDSSSSSPYEVAVKGVKSEPRVSHYSVPHPGTVNRITSMPQHPEIVATLSETGMVHVFNVTNAVAARMTHTLCGHRAEGFALAWSPHDPWTLAAGDTEGRVIVHRVGERGEQRELVGHSAAVEGVAWSPTERNVLVTCSSDRSIRVWNTDSSEGRECAVTLENAHDGDVNVVAWNRKDTHLLLSGGEDGTIKVWDLRQLKGSVGAASAGSGACVAALSFHRGAIVSLDWHPRDPAMLVAASRDGSVSVWDLSVERDEAAGEAEAKHGGLSALPPQLMFLHHQKEASEARWHPLLPSVLFSAAIDGINIWKPATL